MSRGFLPETAFTQLEEGSRITIMVREPSHVSNQITASCRRTLLLSFRKVVTQINKRRILCLPRSHLLPPTDEVGSQKLMREPFCFRAQGAT